MTLDERTSVELALSELRRAVDVGLTEIRGQLALLIQEREQADRRADEQAQELDELGGRVAAVEQHGVTRADLERKSARTIQILGVVAAVVGIIAGAVTSVIIAAVT